MAKFSCNFISYTLRRAVDITVIIPSVTIPESIGFRPDGTAAPKPAHTKKDPYPILYLLHGYGNNHATWGGYTRIELFAEERNIAVVMLSAENKSYVNHGGDDNYFDFIADELPDFIGGMFPVSKRPEDTFIAGLSMGGYGALVHGFSHPERFAAVGAFSAAVNLDPAMSLGGSKIGEAMARYDPMTLAKQAKDGKAKLPKLFITCGDKDFLYAANITFKDELTALGFDVTWEGLPDYQHEWRFWDLQVERYLKWIPRTDPYAAPDKRPV
jgi:putative tributyrin esterase